MKHQHSFDKRGNCFNCGQFYVGAPKACKPIVRAEGGKFTLRAIPGKTGQFEYVRA